MKWDKWTEKTARYRPPEDKELFRLRSQQWLRQLRREFETLNARFALGLRPPVLALHQGFARLGFWQKDSRRLSISANLIEQYGWPAALLVLKHEMAHQMADESLGGAGKPHDGRFLAACQTLDLPFAFCRAAIDENTLAAVRRESEQGHPLLNRVKKLLALAQSDNIHEAALALAKARQLLAGHQAAEADLSGEDVIYLPIVLSTRRVSSVTRRLCGLISAIFPVSVVESSLYDPWRDKEMPVFEVFGRRGAAHCAAHAWHFLAERLESLWSRERRQSEGGGRRGRDSFMLGVLQGFAEAWQKTDIAAQARPANHALVAAAADPAVAARLSRRYPRLHSRKLAGRMVASRQYEKGIEAGRRLKLHDAVAQKTAAKCLPTGKGGGPDVPA